MKTIISLIVLVLYVCHFSVGADKPEYAVSNIPEELKKDADYVVRHERIVFNISSIGKASFSVHVVYTILNKRATNMATLVLNYDKYRKIKYIKGSSYDQFGKQNENLKAAQIFDGSYTPDGTFVDDARIKVAELSVPSYPYTFEFEYEIESNALSSYPDWQPQRLKEAVQYSEYTVMAPENIPIKYKLLFLECKFSESIDKGIKSYSWSVNNLPAIKEYEPLSNGYSKYNSRLLVAPIDFEYMGFQGNTESWSNLGKWILQINKDRDQLPDATKEALIKMTVGLSDQEKVAKVYKYLQSRTRYVGVQLGIGGLQPAEASFVDKVGYGDCKGLTNYMMAMLKSIGIQSYYTLVNSGNTEPDIVIDFVDDQFDHVILCVPIKQDTIWLECTSQSHPFGFLGRFTANRHALLITEDGGKLVKTQNFCSEKNYQIHYAEANIDENGNLSANLETQYGGFQSDIYTELKTLSHDKQKKWYYENVSVSNLDLKDFQFEVKENPDGEVTEKLDMWVPRYASVSNKRLFFTPNIVNKWNSNLSNLESRLSNIELKYPYTDTDTVKIFLPKSYHPEFIPEEKSLKTDFGEYFSKIVPEERSITYIRKMKIYGGTYPPEKYKELQDFYKEIQKADNTKVILINET